MSDVDRRPRVAELFAGVGGFRLGLEAAGFRTVFSNQWEPSTKRQHASECYVARFGPDGHSNDDITRVLDGAEDGSGSLPDFDLLVGGFPCFAAGTLVLTESGYLPIETILVGDRVLTHRGHWRPVTAVMHREAPTTLQVHGDFPAIRTTDEHPFWARRGHEPARWIDAAQLDDRTRVAQVLPTERLMVPALPCEASLAWWITARVLADGELLGETGSSTVWFAGRRDELERIGDRLDASGWRWWSFEDGDRIRFAVSSPELRAWLGQFILDGTKVIPGWVYSAGIDAAIVLLETFAAATDGSVWQDGWVAAADGRPLALGMALLTQAAYGLVATVEQGADGAWRIGELDEGTSVDGELGWKRVRRVLPWQGTTVYNIAVADDESYVVEGVACHNCQDYSVAKTLKASGGIAGKKGVLWWQVHRMLAMKRPAAFFLENVDRLIKSPATQRGRDFAIMLASVADLGYRVEWRVVNAADYGFPQRRRRIFLIGRLGAPVPADPVAFLRADGVLARALPVLPFPAVAREFDLAGDLSELTASFNAAGGASPFESAGLMAGRRVWTVKVSPDHAGPRTTLGDVLEPHDQVPDRFWIPDTQLPTWRYLKGAKREERVHASGGTYHYTEGPVAFPDRADGPSRTLLTSEGSSSPSRMTHVVAGPDGRLRRLTPRELERLDGFPDDWTDTMSDVRRGFMMGNALVVGLIERVGRTLVADLAADEPGALPRAA